MGKIKIIASVSANGVIGNKGDLVLRDSEDMKRFKRLTLGQVVVMGRKTWESLGSKALVDRWNIIISNTPVADKFIEDISTPLFNNLDETLEQVDLMKEQDLWDIWIIGGGQIYQAFMEHADELHITKWFKEVDGDTFFPNIDENVWRRKFIEYPLNSTEFVYETWVKK